MSIARANFRSRKTQYSPNLVEPSYVEITVSAPAELSAVAMRRMRGAAIVVTAMAIGRALIAFVGFALVRTKLAPCFGFAGTSVMPAFHVLYLSP